MPEPISIIARELLTIREEMNDIISLNQTLYDHNEIVTIANAITVLTRAMIQLIKEKME